MVSKQALRRKLLQTRGAIADHATRSEQIWSQIRQQPSYRLAHSVLYYVSVRSEVDTRIGIELGWQADKRVAVPFCEGDHLLLFRIQNWEELTTGRFQVPEPRPTLRNAPDRYVAPQELDLLFVPGVAFDPQGGRLGYGKGYFDRLLARTSAHALRMGLAFESQMVAKVPTEPHDVPMDWVITEDAVYHDGRRIPHPTRD
jgi:5-formyltetrahydrofolate cyclo-ligase